MARPLAEQGDFTRGSTINYPFRPGGLQVGGTAEPSSPSPAGGSGADEPGHVNFSTDLLWVPPGFEVGLECGAKPETAADGAAVLLDLPEAGTATNNVISFSSLIDLDDDDDDGGEAEAADGAAAPSDASQNQEVQSDVDAILAEPAAAATNRRKADSKTSSAKTWAVIEDSSMEEFHSLVPEMAREYPFELDTFQKQAVVHLERHESVFVAAHTSAGKTVVAEYAIALSAKHMTRCIYTSPIKALSNQKFRDFQDQGIDVGLLTGDVQIRPEASCLIMTTEILRSMLYRGADLIRDVEWVIFDEVHYINDAERGVVWEEVIIMLPEHVNLILLSATVPNTFEFADWIGRTKQKNVYVMGTLKRPVPLEHFLYTGNSKATSNELFKIVDSHSKLLQDGYKKAARAKNARTSDKDKTFGAKGRQQGRGGSDKGLYVSLVGMLEKKELRPCVVFTFSRKRCETNADSLNSMDLTSSAEKATVHHFVDQSVNRLKGSDRDLPQISRMRGMLKRGIGVHHAGLLPIVKEMVELLFGKGLIRVLFATETFAMGVNMPARCCVFDTIRKFDGTKNRDLLPGEYVQMAGRAGRRGLDPTGTVIILVKGDLPELSELNQMILGKSTRLDSKFRLTYNMILNLLRVEELRVEDMMKRSFAENFNQKDAADNSADLVKASEELKAMKDVDCETCTDLGEFYDTCSELLARTHDVQAHLLAQGIKYLSAGRVIVVNNPQHRNALAVILRVEAKRSRRDEDVSTAASQKFSVLVIADAKGGEDAAAAQKRAAVVADAPLPLTRLFKPAGALSFEVCAISGTDIFVVGKAKIKVNVLETLERPNPAVQSDVAQQLLRMVRALLCTGLIAALLRAPLTSRVGPALSDVWALPFLGVCRVCVCVGGPPSAPSSCGGGARSLTWRHACETGGRWKPRRRGSSCCTPSGI